MFNEANARIRGHDPRDQGAPALGEEKGTGSGPNYGD
jgi:hypothetical protein